MSGEDRFADNYIWHGYVYRTDLTKLHTTTSPTTDYDFTGEVYKTTGISGLTYLMYHSVQVMEDWNHYALESTTDFANESNVGNYDGKALRIKLERGTPLVRGDTACIADDFKYTSWEDGALCLQWQSETTVRTHRLTPTEWNTWKELDLGTEGVVLDPSLETLMPGYLDGSNDFESWEVFNCETITSDGYTCDIWLKTEITTRNGYPRFQGGFAAEAAYIDVDATANAEKREFVNFQFEAATQVYAMAATVLTLTSAVQMLM